MPARRSSVSGRRSPTRSAHLANRTHRRAADRRRPGRDDRRSRDRRRVDGRRARTPTTGATRTSASAGPVVRGLQGAFAENWLEATGEVLGGERLPARSRARRRRRADAARSARAPASAIRTPRRIYYLAIASAQRSIDLTAAYFAPRPAFTEALCDAAERGVDVRVLVPGPHIDKELRAAGGPGVLRAAAGRAACGSSSTSRRCCTRRRSRSTDAGRPSGRSTSTTAPSSSTTRSRSGCWDERFAGELGRAVRARPRAQPRRSTPSAGGAARSRSGSARPRPPCFAASSDPPILRAVRERRPRRGGRARSRARSLVARRRRHPVLAAIADADQIVLRLLRTRGHQEPVEVGDAGARR